MMDEKEWQVKTKQHLGFRVSLFPILNGFDVNILSVIHGKT